MVHVSTLLVIPFCILSLWNPITVYGQFVDVVNVDGVLEVQGPLLVDGNISTHCMHSVDGVNLCELKDQVTDIVVNNNKSDELIDAIMVTLTNLTESLWNASEQVSMNTETLDACECAPHPEPEPEKPESFIDLVDVHVLNPGFNTSNGDLDGYEFVVACGSYVYFNAAGTGATERTWLVRVPRAPGNFKYSQMETYNLSTQGDAIDSRKLRDLMCNNLTNELIIAPGDGNMLWTMDADASVISFTLAPIATNGFHGHFETSTHFYLIPFMTPIAGVHQGKITRLDKSASTLASGNEEIVDWDAEFGWTGFYVGCADEDEMYGYAGGHSDADGAHGVIIKFPLDSTFTDVANHQVYNPADAGLFGAEGWNGMVAYGGYIYVTNQEFLNLLKIDANDFSNIDVRYPLMWESSMKGFGSSFLVDHTLYLVPNEAAGIPSTQFATIDLARAPTEIFTNVNDEYDLGFSRECHSDNIDEIYCIFQSGLTGIYYMEEIFPLTGSIFSGFGGSFYDQQTGYAYMCEVYNNGDFIVQVKPTPA